MKKKQLYQRAILIILFLIATSFASALPITIDNSSNNHDMFLQYQYTFSEPQIISKNDDDALQQIVIDGLHTTNEYLQPNIPVKPLTLLLPYATKLKSIELETSSSSKIEDITLEKSGAVIPLSHYEFNRQANTDPKGTYQPQKIQSLHSIQGTYRYHGYTILILNLYPAQYDPNEKTVDFYKNIDVTIQLSSSSSSDSFRGCSSDLKQVSHIIDNPEVLETYTKNPPTSFSQNEYEYVIITNNAMKQAQGTYTFQDLIEYKESKGISATIVTVEEINANPDYTVNGIWGDNNMDNPFISEPLEGSTDRFDDTQAHIRNFIRFAYLNWKTKYVLLAGDSDTANPKDMIVPHRGLYADEQGLPLEDNMLAYEVDDIPSDVYYACLDGNFNYDEDQHFGEAPKFNIRNDSLDEADLYAEVSVGRACVDSEEEVSNFVKKCISYDELFYDEYFTRVLFLGEHLGSAFYFNYGGRYKDLVEPLFPSTYNITKLYHEDDSWDSTTYWYLLNEHPPLIINHDGHGSPTSAMGLNCPAIEDLSNDYYYFIYSHTCLAGSFDNCWPPDTYYDSDCVAEYFTVETEHGAIATIFNARYGLGSETSPDSPSGLLDESFFTAVFEQDIRQFGPANHYSKQDHIWHINENGMRWVFYETNLFGDPQLSLKDPLPNIDVSVDITNPIDQGCLYMNDGQPIMISFLKNPVIINGLTIKADVVSDPKGYIEYVEFICNDKIVFTDSEYPYEYYWDKGNIGPYTIQVIAHASYDSIESDEVSIFYLW